jgi:hypothetical protein
MNRADGIEQIGLANALEPYLKPGTIAAPCNATPDATLYESGEISFRIG